MAERVSAAPSPRAAVRSAAAPPVPRRGWSQLPLGRWLLLLGGALLGLALLDQLWPPPDPAARQEEIRGARGLAPQIARPIVLLLIGSDADRQGGAGNGAAPPGPANADGLLLVRVDPRGPVQLLALPTELAVRLPGQRSPQSLGSLYRQGGVALTADAVRELVGLGGAEPDRYLVLSRSALRRLVDGLGGLEISPERSMDYQDRTLGYRIQLQAGPQLLKGSAVEQLLRFRGREEGEEARRRRQWQVAGALHQQMGQPERLARLPALLVSMEGEVETNLSRPEALSLLATALGGSQPIRFDQLPLEPSLRPGQRLRQLDRGVVPPLWPAATAAAP